MMTSHDIDVIIAAHDIARYGDLRRAVASVHAQTCAAGSIVVAVDHAPDLHARASQELDATVVANDGSRGASGTRNTGARATHGRAMAFLDDDATAAPDWLEKLVQHLNASGSPGVTGKVLPAWRTREPAWWPPEFLWLVGASYRGQPTDVVPVRNAWSVNMCVRRHAFDAVGGFREGFGKTGGVSSPEDTDFCLRVNQWAGESAWLNAPDAVVHHVVPESRSTAGFFLRRSFNEGHGKAVLRSLVGESALSAEASYARSTLPRGFARGLVEAARGDLSGLGRSVAIVAGFGATAAGYALGRLRSILLE